MIDMIDNNKIRKIRRCAVFNCNRKLKLTDFPCKCEKTFCSFHRYKELHNCDYDYTEQIYKDKKIYEMKCVSEKIDKI
jgi:hypothetical protein